MYLLKSLMVSCALVSVCMCAAGPARGRRWAEHALLAGASPALDVAYSVPSSVLTVDKVLAVPQVVHVPRVLTVNRLLPDAYSASLYFALGDDLYTGGWASGGVSGGYASDWW